MSIKMKELMSITNESKSTILFYVKEGLLPPPEKPKPNVHLYHESSIAIIKFIKNLQNNFSYSISDIKAIFLDNNFDFDGSFEMMLKSIELISGTKSQEFYNTKEFLAITGIDEESLDEYISKNYIFQRDSGFSKKEIEIVEILEKAKELDMDTTLFDKYVEYGKVLAIEENSIGAKLLKDETNTHNQRYELLFDVILKLKPYIFNMLTVEKHQNNISKD